MSYQEFLPDPSLGPFIDAYWIMNYQEPKPVTQRIMPDGCIDIIVNSGNDLVDGKGRPTMKNEKTYLVGTMTRYADITIQANTQLTGIRFKPLGFSAFFSYGSFHEITNQTVPFDKISCCLPQATANDQIRSLERFFLNQRPSLNHTLATVLSSVNNCNGRITVEKLAKQQFITRRQLERQFRQFIGISPKEYINFVRYRFALKEIKRNVPGRNLLDIALATGFYDHSHLSSELKRFSGSTPSQL